MSLNPVSLLEKAINEHGSSAILKERIALVKDMLSKVEKEKGDLERENDDLKKRLAIAEAEIERLKSRVTSTKFVEYGGVKFRRKPSGGFEKSVYCPSCEVGMATVDSDMPFVCGKCHSLSGFNSGDLISMLREVESEYP